MNKLKDIPDVIWAMLLLALFLAAYRAWHEDWIRSLATTDAGVIFGFFTGSIKEGMGAKNAGAGPGALPDH